MIATHGHTTLEPVDRLVFQLNTADVPWTLELPRDVRHGRSDLFDGHGLQGPGTEGLLSRTTERRPTMS
jgi:hypothetical protein